MVIRNMCYRRANSSGSSWRPRPAAATAQSVTPVDTSTSTGNHSFSPFSNTNKKMCLVNIILSKNPCNPKVHTYKATSAPIFASKFGKKISATNGLRDGLALNWKKCTHLSGVHGPDSVDLQITGMLNPDPYFWITDSQILILKDVRVLTMVFYKRFKEITAQ